MNWVVMGAPESGRPSWTTDNADGIKPMTYITGTDIRTYTNIVSDFPFLERYCLQHLRLQSSPKQGEMDEEEVAIQ